MALEKHTIELAAKDTLSPALKNIATNAENAGRKAEEAGKKGTASTQDWSRAASNMGKVLGGLGAIAIKLGNESEVAQTRLEASIANTGDAYDTLKDKIDDATDAALAFAFDDEDAINAISTLTDATGSAETAIRDLAVAQDIARGRGIDLAAATNIVVAAETGRIGSLKRMGIAIDANATAEEAVAALQAKYAGQAAAYATTNAAAWDRMGNTIENALEAVGGHLADIQGPLIALGGASQLIGPLGDAFEAMGGKAKIASLATSALSSSWLGPVGLAVGAAAAGVAIYALVTRESDAEKQAKALASATDDYTASIIANTTALVNAGTYDQVQQTKALLDVWIQDGAVAKSRIDEVNKAITELDDQSQLSGTVQSFSLDQLIDQFGNLDQAQKDWIVTQLESNGALADGVVSAAELTAILPALQSGFSLSAGDAASLTTAMQGIEEAAANPDLYGSEIAAESAKILSDLHNKYIDVNEAIARLNALPLDPKFNVALRENAKSAYEATDAYKYASTEWKASAPVIVAATDAIDDNTDALEQNAAQSSFIATNYSASLPVITMYTGEAAAATGVTEVLGRAMTESGTRIDETAKQLDALNDTLSDVGASGLDRYMGMIVGFTNGIVSSVGAAKDWADSLIGVRGVLSDVDKYFKEGSPEWENAQKAQESITADYNRTLEASQKIQILQAPLIAAQADAAADYIEKIAGMNAGEQLLALAWADQDMSGRAMQIADMAAEFGDMSDAQKQAFGSMVTSAAATDPALAAVLESLGLIKKSTTDPSGWEVTLGTSQAEDSIDKLATAMAILIATITGTPDVAVNADLDSEEFWKAYYALPSSKDLTLYINTVGGDGLAYHALGGTAKDSLDHAALGRVGRGMAMVGENGPELVTLPHGSVVTPNHATRYAKNGGSSDGGGMVIQNMTVVANSPQEFMRQMRQYEQGMNRR